MKEKIIIVLRDEKMDKPIDYIQNKSDRYDIDIVKINEKHEKFSTIHQFIGKRYSIGYLDAQFMHYTWFRETILPSISRGKGEIIYI